MLEFFLTQNTNLIHVLWLSVMWVSLLAVCGSIKDTLVVNYLAVQELQKVTLVNEKNLVMQGWPKESKWRGKEF